MEARKGKPGHGTTLEPETLAENHAPGGPKTATRPWGVLSGIVLGARESRVHGEGPDGSTQPAKETRAGHVGLEPHEPTSLRGISKRARASKDPRFQNLNRCLNAEFLRECWQDLNKEAASGVDGVTAAHYQENLEANIQDLAKRLESGNYRAKRIRRCYIPKENGKERPLGIPALEDKLVQLACAKLLNALFEEDFLEFSYGYRPARSAKEAVSDLTFNLQYGSYGYLVEADIQGFFDHIDHDWLLEMLEQRIDDRAFFEFDSQMAESGNPRHGREDIEPGNGDAPGRDYLADTRQRLSALRLGPLVRESSEETSTGRSHDVSLRGRFRMRVPLPGRCRKVLSGITRTAGKVRFESRAGKDQNPPVQPLSSRHEAPVCLSRLRVLLVSGSARRTTGQAPHRAEEAARRLSANQGMDQGKPSSTWTTVHQGTEPAVTRAL